MRWLGREILIGLRKSFPRTIISVISFAFAMAFSMFTYQLVITELNMNKSFERYDDIYRISLKADNMTSRLPGQVGEYIRLKMPAVEEVVRITRKYGDHVFRFKDVKMEARNVIMADSGFFKLFSIPFVFGSEKDCLNQMRSVVLSEDFSRKIFGGKSPVGEEVSLFSTLSDTSLTFSVTAVIENPEKYSHITADIIMPVSSDADLGNLGSWNYSTYLLFAGGVNIPESQKQLNESLKEYFRHSQSRRLSGSDFVFSDLAYVYFGPELRPAFRKGNKIRLLLVVSASLILLFISVINFSSLSVLIAMKGIKAQVIRRICGAEKRHLVLINCCEAITFSYISLLLGFGLFIILSPYFYYILGLPQGDSHDYSFRVILIYFAFASLVGLISGIYPSIRIIILSSARTGLVHVNSNKRLNTKIVFLLQTVLSVSMIGIITVIHLQYRHIRKTDLGYDAENLLYIKSNKQLAERWEAFRYELLRIRGVNNISKSYGTYLNSTQYRTFDFRDREIGMHIEGADEDYLSTLGLELVSGRDFRGPSDYNRMIVNETACREYFGSDPGGIILANLEGAEIVGVVKDFNFQSLENKVEPLGIWYRDFMKEVISIRLDDTFRQDITDDIEYVWDRFCPDYPYNISYVSDIVSERYMRHRYMGIILSVLTALVICISAIGVYGMSSFIVIDKSREVVIRKVFGGSYKQLLRILTMDINIVMLLSVPLSLPVVWLTCHRISTIYEYHIGYPIWVFPLSVLTVWIIALLSSSGSVLKTASLNPARVLAAD